jgi:hypothetical protein
MGAKLKGKSEVEHGHEFGTEEDMRAYGAVSNRNMEKTA